MSPRTVTDVRYDFSGKVVLVTGAARALGRAHALAFAEAGADLVICDVARQDASTPYSTATDDDLTEVAATIEDLGVRAFKAHCDVRDSAAVDAMVGEALERFGQIDVLVNNAGVNSVAPVHEMSDETWRSVIDTQLTGSFNCARAVSRSMIDRTSGRILFTGSVLSFLGVPENAHYVAAKHGILGMGRALAAELAQYAITVNVVCPGSVATPMVGGMTSAFPQWLERITPMTGAGNLLPPGDMLDPQDVTQAMLWLASDAAAYVTGTALVVDGGSMIT